MNRIGHFLAAAVAAALTGSGACILLLLVHVVGKLYLAGHSIEPRWYDATGSAVVFGGALLVATIALYLVWKAARGSGSGEKPRS
jgi:hypothetical protein